jgi:hypothetical protein
VISVDSAGTVHVKWDDGSTLGLIPDEDQWEVLTQSQREALGYSTGLNRQTHHWSCCCFECLSKRKAR